MTITTSTQHFCPTCGQVFQAPGPHNEGPMLLLPLPDNGSDRNSIATTLRLDQLIRTYFQRTPSAYTCLVCPPNVGNGPQVNGWQEERLESAPDMLAIQLQRWYRPRSTTTAKDYRGVRINRGLDLGPYYRTAGNHNHFARYRLTGLILHRGNQNGGHYVAKVRAPDDRWYIFNDDHVDPQNAREARTQRPSETNPTPEACFTPYVLFYERLYYTEEPQGPVGPVPCNLRKQ